MSADSQNVGRPSVISPLPGLRDSLALVALPSDVQRAPMITSYRNRRDTSSRSSDDLTTYPGHT